MMKIKLLAFDLDGTLLHPILNDRLIADEYVKMLQDFYDSGVSLCIVTGRGINFATKIEKIIDRKCYKVCFNGAYIPDFECFYPVDIDIVRGLYQSEHKVLFFSKV